MSTVGDELVKLCYFQMEFAVQFNILFLRFDWSKLTQNFRTVKNQ